MTTLAEIAEVSNVEAATRGYSKAVDRMRHLEQLAEATFAEYAQARDRLVQVGVNADVDLEPGIAAAFSHWKQQQARKEVAGVGAELTVVDWAQH